jgi:hypothetical protein
MTVTNICLFTLFNCPGNFSEELRVVKIKAKCPWSNDVSEFKEAEHKLYATSTETRFMRQTIDIFYKRNNTMFQKFISYSAKEWIIRSITEKISS